MLVLLHSFNLLTSDRTPYIHAIAGLRTRTAVCARQFGRAGCWSSLHAITPSKSQYLPLSFPFTAPGQSRSYLCFPCCILGTEASLTSLRRVRSSLRLGFLHSRAARLLSAWCLTFTFHPLSQHRESMLEISTDLNGGWKSKNDGFQLQHSVLVRRAELWSTGDESRHKQQQRRKRQGVVTASPSLTPRSQARTHSIETPLSLLLPLEPSAAKHDPQTRWQRGDSLLLLPLS